MSQRRDSDIEELLNSFIDGELTRRQQIEVEQLMAYDPQVAQQLNKLRAIKILVSNLPRAEVPPEMVQEVRAALERRALLDQGPERPAERIGARHLMARKVLAAAAMIGLVAALGIVIYSIVAPETGTEGPVLVRHRDGPADTSVLTGRLEFKTSNLAPVDASIAKAIDKNTLVTCSSPRRQTGKSVYALGCSEPGLNQLLWDLGGIWGKFDSATLYLETGQFGRPVVIENVTASQIAEIAKQESHELQVRTAMDFAILNTVAARMRDEQVLPAIEGMAVDLPTIPKPKLVGPEESPHKSPTPTEHEQNVSLTIVVTATK